MKKTSLLIRLGVVCGLMAWGGMAFGQETAPAEVPAVEPAVPVSVVDAPAVVEPGGTESVVADPVATPPVVAEPGAEAPAWTEPVVEAAAATGAGETEAPVVERVEATEAVDSGVNPEKIALTLTDTELVQVVDLFIKISGANIIASPTNLTGRVTVSLRDVDWKTALLSILETQNLTLVETLPESKVFSIVPKPKDAPEPLFVENFKLQFLPAESLKDAAKQLVDPQGKVLLAQGNKLSVLGTARKIQTVRELVDSVDKRVPQVVVESKFVELDDQAIKDLGINWQSLEGYTVSLSRPKMDFNVQTTRRDLDQQAGVNVATTLDSATRTTPSAGTDARTVNSSVNNIGVTGKNFTEFTEGELTTVPTYDKIDTRTFTASILSAEELALTLSALKQNTGTEIVSNPKIVVASGETSSIHVGQRRPNIVLQTASTTAGTANQSYEFGDPPWIETGVKVKVTPTVNTESNITVRIVPELDREIGLIEPQPGLTFPILASRKIESQFALESGKTVAIGGLTQTTDNEVVKKIPFLGDIPIIGKYLFSHSHTEKRQSEVIIFVTVVLAESETLSFSSGIPSEGRLITSRFENPEAAQLTLRSRWEDTEQAPERWGSAKGGSGEAAETVVP